MRICFVGRPRGNSIGFSYTADNILKWNMRFRTYLSNYLSHYLSKFINKNKILANRPKMLIVALLIMTNTGTNLNARLEVSALWNIY